MIRKRPVITVIPLEAAGITPDPANARLHSPRNIGVIEDSMQTDGAGRSILVDQHGVTIAGAGAWEAATQAGIPHAAIIETDGDTLVIVKRTVTPEQRVRLALADNRATDLSSWNVERLQQLQAEAPALLRSLWTDAEFAALIEHAVDLRDGRTDPDAVLEPPPPRSNGATCLPSVRIASCAAIARTSPMSSRSSMARCRS